MRPIEILALGCYQYMTKNRLLLKCKNAEGRICFCTLEVALRGKYELVDIGNKMTVDDVINCVTQAITAGSIPKTGGLTREIF